MYSWMRARTIAFSLTGEWLNCSVMQHFLERRHSWHATLHEQLYLVFHAYSNHKFGWRRRTATCIDYSWQVRTSAILCSNPSALSLTSVGYLVVGSLSILILLPEISTFPERPDALPHFNTGNHPQDVTNTPKPVPVASLSRHTDIPRSC
jgi:hypothetical protein